MLWISKKKKRAQLGGEKQMHSYVPTSVISASNTLTDSITDKKWLVSNM